MQALHGEAIDGLEEAARNDLAAVYERLADGLATELRRAMADGTTANATHAAQIANQLGTYLVQWSEQSGNALAVRTRQALGEGLRQLSREVLEAEALVNPGGLSERMRTWAPVVPADTVAYLEATGNLVLNRFGREAVAEAVKGALAESVALGEGTAATVRRMRGSLTAQDWQLERIARTEINAAANFGHQAALSQQVRAFPELGLLKQWSAHRDRRTSQVCLALDGQIVAPEAEFSTAGLTTEAGRALPAATYRTPPAHPNCRSRLVPYSNRWAGL